MDLPSRRATRGDGQPSLDIRIPRQRKDAMNNWDQVTMGKVRRTFPRPGLARPGEEIRRQLDAGGVPLQAGERIAIAVGSRGIANLAEMVRATVAWVRARGADPFLVPAMGSHGGATADGQRQVLTDYGITEAAVGAPIRSSMEVIELPADGVPMPVFFDRVAAAADGTILLNRVKPHTSFHGTYESGLMKMAAIGLGKQRQAEAIHRLGVAGLRDVMPAVARQVLRHGNIRLGIAVVENAYDETMLVRAIPADRIPEEEPALLELARLNMPCLPVDRLDVLIVDEVGKNISGLGMDTNIIGRLKIRGQPEPASPDIAVIIVRGLTAESRGNATGIGLADVITRRAYAQIDLRSTYANVLTSGFLERGKIPVIADNDREALRIALGAAGLDDWTNARIVRIRNTLHLEELYVSPAVRRDMAAAVRCEILGAYAPAFPAGDDLPAF